MDYALLVGFAGVLLIAGLGLIYITLKGNKPFWPKDGFQWAAVGLSSVLVILAGFLVVMLATNPESTVLGPSTEVAGLNEPAENFSFRLVGDNVETDLEAYKGKVVLLNFWATWCGPCLIELPDLNKLQEEYADQGLVVLTISDEPRTDLQTFEEVMPLQTVTGYINTPAALAEPFRQVVQVRPITFVIDRDGIIRESFLGAGSFDMFAEAVSPYLAQTVAQR